VLVLLVVLLVGVRLLVLLVLVLGLVALLRILLLVLVLLVLLVLLILLLLLVLLLLLLLALLLELVELLQALHHELDVGSRVGVVPVALQALDEVLARLRVRDARELERIDLGLRRALDAARHVSRSGRIRLRRLARDLR